MRTKEPGIFLDSSSTLLGEIPFVSDSILEWEAAGKHLLIRDVLTHEDFRETENIQREAWSFDDLDVVPAAHLIAAKWAGGIVLGAFDSDRMIGFVYGFPALENGHISLHSHMLAVRPESRNLRAGIQLKVAQRKKAIEMGVREISWTFDPLQTLNAHLNFTRLGVVSERYLVNFYGEETSSPLHRGVGTDRLWVRWLINTDRVKTRLRNIETGENSDNTNTSPVELEKELGNLFAEQPERVGLEPVLLAATEGKWKRVKAIQEAALSSNLLIEIPSNMFNFKKENIEAALNWRQSVQDWLVKAFSIGFVAVDFLNIKSSTGSRWFYHLIQGELENNE
jgi:predicted GNAT superfamily acetyltransferase